ncbi:CASP-like protein 4D1 [Salvia hispanica]|uniref:CASP-like protein 4D1 n=1 Tax=Salvia hispanica TaxID=49212 RepID=UPI002009C32E|nr:CASP-like protein 4D1 [Salvia hispanica]
MSKNQDVETAEIKCGKFSAAVVTARAVTTASLTASIAVLLTNEATLVRGYVFTYKHVFSYSYKYMFYVALFGIAANFLCTMHYILTKQRLINSYITLLKFCFYVDKMTTVVVATGGGAAFCATVDLKRVEWNEYNSKKQDFVSVGYVAAAFAVVGCISSLSSSIHSSLALTNTI